jgi:hypothetical protein
VAATSPTAAATAVSGNQALVPTQNASSMLRTTRTGPRLSSGSASFDSLIFSSDSDQLRGLMPGQLLELSGCPGEGKTRTCISYAIQACKLDDAQDINPRVLIIGELTLLSLLCGKTGSKLDFTRHARFDVFACLVAGCSS